MILQIFGCCIMKKIVKYPIFCCLSNKRIEKLLI